MLFKKISIVLAITLTLFAVNISLSHAFNTSVPAPISNQYIKDLELIDNNMYILVKYIVAGNYKEDKVEKDIKFIETAIDTLTVNTAKLTQSDNDAILSMQSILNYYKISLIRLKSYFETKDPDNLIDAITSFSTAYDSSNKLREIIGGAGK
ncbi:hypothetical protein C672_2001 [[Clostridium] bifermentans ATCC 638]|uniref:DUF5667 domain-containing protein n=1 Tax=Paraclostridium bifermentans ATCC 638 = DSM 14991 TaxID=1233171 RepID=T4VQT8_PARBF|nr:hypothetical protein [Paraclostridium bifermentans]EQK43057.1 hypothetical protein C672_2001 [[Clostridium] bifermentans ATCC 638] [Paraclostridium bifermentans ATCC 638 = DSM 14991]RIZ60289.1 hypothetical protein CHH45_00545 [Paraclostridium bifermentans]UAG16930.1 hypothetical protein KXZ80_09025 [Paraclostridium bifermentans]